MRSPVLRRIVTSLLAGLLTGLLAASPLVALPAAAQTASESTVVYLVRHAEKVDNSRDPALSQSGLHRADLLADMLRDAGVTHLHTTDFERTRDTLRPLAEQLASNLPIEDWIGAVGHQALAFRGSKQAVGKMVGLND